MQDPWSHSVLALSLCLGQSCLQTPGSAVTGLFAAEESRRLSFPALPLSNLSTAHVFESRKLCAAQSRVWLVLQSLVRGAEAPAVCSCLLQPPSVCTNSLLFTAHPGLQGTACSFGSVGRDNQSYQDLCVVTASVCGGFSCVDDTW